MGPDGNVGESLGKFENVGESSRMFEKEGPRKLEKV